MLYHELLEARIEALADVLLEARKGLASSRGICVRAAHAFGMADSEATKDALAAYDELLARIDRVLENTNE